MKVGLKELARQTTIYHKRMERLARLCLKYQKLTGLAIDTYSHRKLTDPVPTEISHLREQIKDLLIKAQRFFRNSYLRQRRLSSVEAAVFHFQRLRAKRMIPGRNVRKWNIDRYGKRYSFPWQAKPCLTKVL